MQTMPDDQLLAAMSMLHNTSSYDFLRCWRLQSCPSCLDARPLCGWCPMVGVQCYTHFTYTRLRYTTKLLHSRSVVSARFFPTLSPLSQALLPVPGHVFVFSSTHMVVMLGQTRASCGEATNGNCYIPGTAMFICIT